MKNRAERGGVTTHNALWRGREVDWTIYETTEPGGATNLIVPGIMAKQTVYLPLATAMNENGNRVVTMSHESGSIMCPYEVRDVASYLADTYQQPVRLVAHSLGAIHAVEAAAEDPADIEGITFIQPAGFGGVHPTHAYHSIRVRSWLNSEHIRNGVRIGYEGIEYAVRGRRELAKTVIKASTKKVIEEVQNLPNDMYHNAVLFESDPLIRCNEVRRGLAEAGVLAVMLLDHSDATHNAQYDYARDVANTIQDLLTDEEAA